MVQFFLYSVRNVVNGKSYIGQTHRKYVDQRWREHKQAARKVAQGLLYRAMRKYGELSFIFEPLMVFDSQKEVDEAEIALITACGTQGHGGYNLAPGGFGGGPGAHSAETILKMHVAQGSPEARLRKSQQRHKCTPEMIARMKVAQSSPEMVARKKASLTGLKRSSETCAKIKAAQNDPAIKARLLEARHAFRLSPEHKAKLLASNHTPEALAKRSRALRGRPLTPEHRVKLAAARNSPEARAKFSAANSGPNHWRNRGKT